jgi:hypothetical protein
VNIPIGLCHCGCGLKTTIPTRSDSQKQWVKGVPLKWIRGHSDAANGNKATDRAIGNKGLNSQGYVRVLVAKGVRQYEHKLVAEKALGRCLKNFGRGNQKTEVVHHINGIKHDNRPANLLICTHEYHVELHHRLEASPAWPEFQKVIRRTKGDCHV